MEIKKKISALVLFFLAGVSFTHAQILADG